MGVHGAVLSGLFRKYELKVGLGQIQLSELPPVSAVNRSSGLGSGYWSTARA